MASSGFDLSDAEFIVDSNNDTTSIAFNGQTIATFQERIIADVASLGNFIEYEAIDFVV